MSLRKIFGSELNYGGGGGGATTTAAATTADADAAAADLNIILLPAKIGKRVLVRSVRAVFYLHKLRTNSFV